MERNEGREGERREKYEIRCHLDVQTPWWNYPLRVASWNRTQSHSSTLQVLGEGVRHIRRHVYKDPPGQMQWSVIMSACWFCARGTLTWLSPITEEKNMPRASWAIWVVVRDPCIAAASMRHCSPSTYDLLDSRTYQEELNTSRFFNLSNILCELTPSIYCCPDCVKQIPTSSMAPVNQTS